MLSFILNTTPLMDYLDQFGSWKSSWVYYVSMFLDADEAQKYVESVI